MFKEIILFSTIISMPFSVQAASCKKPLDGMIKSMQVPKHAYFSANGQKTGEIISMGDTHYLLLKDHEWKKMTVDAAGDLKDMLEDLKTAKTQCDQLPNEKVNGIDTVVYSIKIKPRDNEESKHILWFNSDNLPVKGITISDSGRTEEVYVYDNIKAPE